MDISGLKNSTYMDLYSGLATTAKANQLSGQWQASGVSAAGSGTDDELMAVCKQFESYLLEQVMKGMIDTTKVFSDEDSSANGALIDFFKDQTLQELCSTSTETQSLGLAQMLYEQMKVTYGIPVAEVSAASDAQQASAQTQIDQAAETMQTETKKTETM